jgi:hypothetical protein
MQYTPSDSQEDKSNEVPDGEVDTNSIVKLLSDNPIHGVCSPKMCISGDDINTSK